MSKKSIRQLTARTPSLTDYIATQATDETTVGKTALSDVKDLLSNISAANATDLTDGGATTLHKHSYNNLDDKLESGVTIKTINSETLLGSGNIVISGGTDEKVKYDAADPTAGYVADKFAAGNGISVAEGTGANENKLLITNSSPDQTVAITSGDGISATGTYPNFTVTNTGILADGSNSNIDELTFDITPASTDTLAEGQMRWNDTDGTLDLGMSGGDITQQIGQEQFVKVKNLSGATLLNGKCIYIDTADSGRPTAKLANNRSYTMTSKTIGIVTKDIPDTEEGYVTTFGKIRGLNTSGFTLGEILYVSDTDGELTNTRPTGSGWVTNVGVVTLVNATVGEIFIRSIQYEKPDELTLISGFPNQNDPDTTISVAVALGVGTFTIEPKAPLTEFHFYQQGIQYRKLASEDIVITDVEGIHWIYYDLGVLSELVNPTATQSTDLFETKTPVAQVYRDATNKEAILIGDERHGFVMSSDTHSYLHLTQGAKWISGMALNTLNATGNGSLDVHAQFGVDEGYGTDEDLRHTPGAILASAGLPIFYLDGANANLRRTAQPGYSVLTDTTAGLPTPTGRLVYNKLTAGTWSLAVVPTLDFVLCHIFATNDSATTPEQPYIAFIGQEDYATLALARTGAESEIGAILTAYPKQELIPVATVIFQTGTTYTNAVKARVVEASSGVSYVDWRKTDIKASAVATPTDHNSLSGKQGGTTGEYFHLTSAEYTGASTTTKGLSPQATAPAAGNLNILGIANTETARTDKLLLDTTAPTTQAFGDTAAAGTSLKAARIDHKHAMPTLPTASDIVSGIVELATAAETTTGTDATRAVTPDGLAGSDFGKRIVQMVLVDDATALTTGDGKGKVFIVPLEMNGWNLVGAHAAVTTVSSSGTPTYQVRNITQTADMLSTRITIDANEFTSYTAATAPVIDTNNDDVATGDRITVDKDVAGTGEKGDVIILSFQTP